MSIQIENVSKSFNDFQALKDVSLHIPSGAMVALLGPSGSGKTTLLRVIAGLEDPDKGRVLFDGQDITGTDVGSRKVGFVFQHYALFRHMSVLENVAFGLRVRPRHLRPSKKEIQDRCHELLRLVQLDGMADRLPTQLSGGQRQRVALARALAIEPKILLLDEPFGALDARVREELRRWLRRLHDELHVTSVFVTHDQEEALEVADTVVVMNHGKIEQVGTADEVYDQPSSQFVISFLGQVNQIRTNGAVLGEAPFGIRSNQVGFVRPHDVEVLTEASEGAVEAVVQRAYRVGPWLRLELAALYAPETVFEAHLPNERFAHRKFQTGDKVFVRAKSLRVFGADAETAGVGA